MDELMDGWMVGSPIEERLFHWSMVTLSPTISSWSEAYDTQKVAKSGLNLLCETTLISICTHVKQHEVRFFLP